MPKHLDGNQAVKMQYADKDVPFETIRNKDFTASYQASDFPGYQKVLWLKLEIVNEDTLSKANYFFYSDAAYYTVYQKTDTGWEEAKNGYLMPLSERTNRKSKKFIPLHLKPQEVTRVFVRLQTGRHIYLVETHPLIGGENFYYKKFHQMAELDLPGTTFSLIYFSSLLIIFFFILVLFISIRDSVYLYYLLYLLFQIIYSLLIIARTPLRFMNLALFYPVLSFIASETTQFIFIGFYILFILYLLEIKTKSTLGRFVRGLAYACFTYAIGSLIFSIIFPGPETHELIFTIVRFIILPIYFVLIIWIIFKVKHALIPYFIIGNLFFFSGAVLSFSVSFLDLNNDPTSIFYFGNSLNTLFQMGLLGEVFCFSFALSHRIRLIQKGKESNAMALIGQLQENKQIQERMNKELDQKVEQKTDELIRVYSEIEQQREKEIKKEFSGKINELETLALRAQMNPHFLFNSMNAIKHLILTNRPEDAMYYLDDFSGLLRSVLQNSQKETITVEDELDVLELYLSLEKGRLGDEFDYEIILDEREVLSQYLIPCLMLQPFVENAIWHGLRLSHKPRKLLTISFEALDDTLIISIRDNGIGREAAREKNKGDRIKTHESLGQQITQDRLALFNHSHDIKIVLKITDLKEGNEPSGTLVTFTYLFNQD